MIARIKSKAERYMERQEAGGVIQIKIMVPASEAQRFKDLGAKARAKHKYGKNILNRSKK